MGLYCKRKNVEADNIVIFKQLQSRLNLSRYSLIRTPGVHKLWYMAYDNPDHFHQLACLFRISSFVVQSKECLCGTYTFDIVKHVFIYCNETQNQRNDLMESIIDVLDVESFCSVWNNDDDVLIAFLLGGLPTERLKSISYYLWYKIMLFVCRTVKLWKRF